MQDPLSDYAEIIAYAFVVLFLIFGYARSRSVSPQVAVFSRWSRWLGVSFGLAYLVYEANWLERPFWVLALLVFLLWLLLETLYTWFAINALSQSNFALFPRFTENATGEEWPTQKKLIELRDWLKAQGFERKQALLADIGGGVNVRSSIFESEERDIRLQILFVPQTNGNISYCLSLSTVTKDGRRIITDNFFMPFGGFYPENWYVVRKPWMRQAKRLLKTHKARLAGLSVVPYESDPVQELNDQQRLLEKTNLEAGFLLPAELQEEHGRISWEGRYRVWKEVWLLNYFGLPSK